MTNIELKEQINKKIEETKTMVSQMERTMKKLVHHEKMDALMNILAYQKNLIRIDQITLMIIISSEQKKSRETMTSLIKKRKEYIMFGMELHESLVSEGAFSEQSYIEFCNYYKRDCNLLDADLNDY